MNILFVSNLGASKSSGPCWSVPARVKAQSLYDNVLWINLCDAEHEHWKDVDGYHNIKDYGDKLHLSVLPKPFDRPDMVVFEGFYFLKSVLFARELERAKIPYIITPRSSLTQAGLNNHAWLKKRIAHLLLFNRFAKHAAAIQYLTKEEFNDSTAKWNVNNFIIPNGISQPIQIKRQFLRDGIRALFIGRIDIYQKGIDLLFEALCRIKEELEAYKFTLDIYGPKRFDWDKVNVMIQEFGLSDLVKLHGEITGDEKRQVIVTSDVFILTSRFEGMPMGVLEALSYGLPVLVSEGSNMAQDVKEYQCGWYGNNLVDSIVASLRSMIANRDKFPSMGEKSLRLAEKYDWKTVALKLHDKIDKLLANI